MKDDYLSLSPSEVAPLVLDAIKWAGKSARERPSDEAISGTLRSTDLASVSALVFPNQNSSNLETAKVKIQDFVQARRLLMRSRTGGEFFRISDALREINRDQSLLLFWPAWSLVDGAATPASEGFIDYECFPPWDTWLAMISEDGGQDFALLAWVPEWGSPLVNDAIQADPAGCLCWVRLEDDRLKKNECGKPWPGTG